MKNQHILVTGCAGFIGSQVALRLLSAGCTVVGVDNVNHYYDVQLKHDRLDQLLHYESFTFHQMDIEDRESIENLFSTEQFTSVIHLAAQAGVRYSKENPFQYINSNIVGFMSILEACRKHPISHLLYASSSSVYGANTNLPFSVNDNVDHPLSLYAATKKANELMAHSYSHLYNIPTTGLRFFTVYGPWGRPDMALFIFAKAIMEGRSIDIYNNGLMMRDFTYIDDIVEGIIRLLPLAPDNNPLWDSSISDPGNSMAPYKVYNIGNNNPVQLMDFITTLEHHLGKKAKKNYMPMQDGDVPETYAEINSLVDLIGYRPKTSIDIGIGKFVDWYVHYYANRVVASKSV
ncbi:UDP-glucuronate 4-epimerase [Paenibacillus shirakamiensis]|uniref:UDP-glucuronate 4-epimerase n=1 Tax=Paenibacillus shirakamiensis TaxID=1265935 RepID=A0ABS4JDZ3_9BACL|nr:NAD-dependent epimerase [Paenibacillus shirakamiensis]MBP1999940.1 UDP-glucuronate 4-epimerase [Paenibacillus shirakamiensis]